MADYVHVPDGFNSLLARSINLLQSALKALPKCSNRHYYFAASLKTNKGDISFNSSAYKFGLVLQKIFLKYHALFSTNTIQ